MRLARREKEVRALSSTLVRSSSGGAESIRLDVPSRGRAVAAAVILAIAFVAVSVGGTFLLGSVAPQLQGKDRDLFVELALAAFVTLVVLALGWRREIGLTGLREWRHLGVLIVPALIVLLPLAAGFRSTATDSAAVLLVGYTANSIAEDGMFSGILPRALSSKGLAWMVVLSALLFGLAHFGNLVSRPDQSAAITAAQALGVFTQGIGLVAIRLVTRSLLAVMAIHFAEDLILQLGAFPIVPANVIESTLFLLFGIWLLRKYRSELASDVKATSIEAGGDAR
jgi:uncharacterized protein